MGSCKYGDNCTYRHDCEEEGGVEEARKATICPFHLNGKCRHKERCLFSHDIESLVKNRLDDKSNPASAFHDSCSAGNNDDEVMDNPDEICGICLGNVVEQGKRFALLSSCDHVYCFDCVRSWHRNPQYRNSLAKAGTDVRHELIKHLCPTCKVTSEHVFPSKVFYRGKEKEGYIEEYKIERSLRPCKFFDGNYGSCPFGRECFYMHLDSKGVNLKPFDVKKLKGEEKDNIQENSTQQGLQLAPEIMGYLSGLLE